MNIQSNSPENIYSRLRKILFNNKIINTINISLIIGSYFVFDAFAVLWFYIGVMVILALITEGEILDKGECRARFSFFIILIGIFIACLYKPVSKISDSLNGLEYIETVTIDPYSTNNKKVIIDFKKPFETGVEVAICDKKFIDPLIEFKNNNEFDIIITKECYSYVIGDSDCKTKLSIYHKYEESEIGSATLKKSIYPKKLQNVNKENNDNR